MNSLKKNQIIIPPEISGKRWVVATIKTTKNVFTNDEFEEDAVEDSFEKAVNAASKMGESWELYKIA